MPFIDPASVPDTGHPMIDQGHRRLVEIVNALYERWRSGEAVDLEPGGRRFLVTLRQHFRHEEAVMADVGLDAATDHRRTHAALLDDFERLVPAMHAAGGAASAPSATVDFFSAAERLVWDHEMVDDQDFWACFAGRGAGPGTLIVSGAPALLGDTDLDDEHATLVRLINELHGALRQGLGVSVLLVRAAGLRTIAAEHFAREEALMARLPETDEHVEHRRQHARLLAELDGAIEDMAYGRYATMETVIGTYLRDWLLEHISTLDRRLVSRLRGIDGGGGA